MSKSTEHEQCNWFQAVRETDCGPRAWVDLVDLRESVVLIWPMAAAKAVSASRRAVEAQKGRRLPCLDPLADLPPRLLSAELTFFGPSAAARIGSVVAGIAASQHGWLEVARGKGCGRRVVPPRSSQPAGQPRLWPRPRPPALRQGDPRAVPVRPRASACARVCVTRHRARLRVCACTPCLLAASLCRRGSARSRGRVGLILTAPLRLGPPLLPRALSRVNLRNPL